MKDFVRQPPQRNSPVKCTAVDCKYNVCFRCRYPAALQFQRVIGAWEAPICKMVWAAYKKKCPSSIREGYFYTAQNMANEGK